MSTDFQHQLILTRHSIPLFLSGYGAVRAVVRNHLFKKDTGNKIRLDAPQKLHLLFSRL